MDWALEGTENAIEIAMAANEKPSRQHVECAHMAGGAGVAGGVGVMQSTSGENVSLYSMGREFSSPPLPTGEAPAPRHRRFLKTAGPEWRGGFSSRRLPPAERRRSSAARQLSPLLAK